ncbi:Lrp/AsnC family transcriptional regulator [Pseudoflavonifractor phocaeensis]|uniref:Lrp/AsnC family transcriptional regulator n=1 Tax=Pseudoflavonifractor phocaeensis TaxID=1870988 RepID=UPI001F39E7EE|nr:Lrp/AsnC family transcriptional regulator [Pseudoflavonifractor phocaeensis]MCF2595454.1 Lrp/AsnC family transcriptional regulator [Pseudoflavonifractor phocaeensis]MDY3905836.1 Lrp/AsnC family transcriptional regulator [Lawsonibacter sp.]
MDRTDYQILNILQADSRTTLRQIGDQVGLTAPAVSERIHRMEEKGIIRDYRIDVDREQLDCSMTGFILVAPEPEKYNSFCEFCQKNPAIISHYHVIGVFNALLRFAVRGTRELDELLSAIKRFGDSQTSVQLKTYFETKEILLPR